jgi:hypothetical protein
MKMLFGPHPYAAWLHDAKAARDKTASIALQKQPRQCAEAHPASWRTHRRLWRNLPGRFLLPSCGRPGLFKDATMSARLFGLACTIITVFSTIVLGVIVIGMLISYLPS